MISWEESVDRGRGGLEDGARGNMVVEVWKLAQEAGKEGRVRLGANQGSVMLEKHFRKKIGAVVSDAVGTLGKDKTRELAFGFEMLGSH